MSIRDITFGEVIYVNPEAGVRVRKGVYSSSNTPVAVKELTSSSLRTGNLVLQESFTHTLLTHPHIVPILDCYIQQTASGLYTSCVVTELMDCDLFSEIESRRERGSYWDDRELLEHLKGLVSALSYAQDHGVSHRDIKPQNIFVHEGQLKVGDFGSATRNLSTANARRKSLQGSPFFLSPELKRAYLLSLSKGKTDLNYDPVRSDVYSLGLTVLYMARLQPPTELMDLERLAAATDAVLSELAGKYPEVTRWLELMLVERPEDRPTFTDIAKCYEGGEAEEEEKQTEPPAILLSQLTIQRLERVPAEPPKPVAERRRKVCVVCSGARGEKWVGVLPPYLRTYQVFAESCCSEACLEKYSGVFKASRCTYCRLDFAIAEDLVRPLHCGHSMHAKCWDEHIRANPNKWRPGVLNCPVCHMETLYVREKSTRYLEAFPILKALGNRLSGMLGKIRNKQAASL